MYLLSNTFFILLIFICCNNTLYADLISLVFIILIYNKHVSHDIEVIIDKLFVSLLIINKTFIASINGFISTIDVNRVGIKNKNWHKNI